MIKVELKAEAITIALAEASAALDDMSPLMGAIADALRDNAEDRFKQGIAPDGSAWAKNSPVTLARKNDARPLWRDGFMAQGLGTDYGRDFAEVGSNAIQSAVMQFGAAQGEFGAFIGKDKLGRDHFHSIPWGDIPARPFIGISDKDETDILALIDDYLASCFKAAT